MSFQRRSIAALGAIAVAVFAVVVGSAQARMGEALSVAAPVPGNGSSTDPAISANGRFVAFDSTASNLVRGDTNHRRDVFVYDRLTGRTERVSVSSQGKQGNGESDCNGISADGRFVLFESNASNLVPGDTNGSWDVFVRDRLKGTTKRVSVSSSGKQGNDWSVDAFISADGHFVAFDSYASNLVPGDNRQRGAYVHDLQTGTTQQVSLSSTGEQANKTSYADAISGDGQFVVFTSSASNLVPGDTNSQEDVFVRDRLTNTTERVSVASDGQQAQGESDINSISSNNISADGRLVAFQSNASNLVAGDTNHSWDVFVRDRLTGTTERVSVSSDGEQGNSNSYLEAISPDGRFVVFHSKASNLVTGDTNNSSDVFVYDRLTGTTERVSIGKHGKQANGSSSSAAISADERFVAFESTASNLVPGDHNRQEIFVRDRLRGKTELVSVGRR